MYYSNEDLENFYVRYKVEGLPKKNSIQEYYLRNKVSWNLFDKWYCDARYCIEEVTVIGRPEAFKLSQASITGREYTLISTCKLMKGACPNTSGCNCLMVCNFIKLCLGVYDIPHYPYRFVQRMDEYQTYRL